MFSRQVPGTLDDVCALTQQAGPQHAEACIAKDWTNFCKCTALKSPNLRRDQGLQPGGRQKLSMLTLNIQFPQGGSTAAHIQRMHGK